MADIIKITPLGGLDESGRDCYVVEVMLSAENVPSSGPST